MASEAMKSIPLACVPGAIPAAERPAHLALIQTLFGTMAEEREPLPEGYRFRFPADVLESLGRFVANERKCCPFRTFVLEASAFQGPVWLRLTGPEGSRDFLDAELNRRS